MLNYDEFMQFRTKKVLSILRSTQKGH